MVEICPRWKCTGCASCYNSCPKGAIKMVEDPCGYVHPVIDPDTCINCALCVKVCPAINQVEYNYPIGCFAAAVKDESELLSSASGGIASLLSRHVISKGGVVYGCTGQDIRNVHHIRIDKVDEVALLKGSKYVQSCIGDVYRQVKQDLKDDRLVLFTGTPCQIAGLYGYLRAKHEHLLTVDLICHGVPSQKMLNDNIAMYAGKDESDITVRFRWKEKVKAKCDAPWRIAYGWILQSSHMQRTYRTKLYNDSYMFGFLGMLTYRSSCYSCKYAHITRCSDITLGDYWSLPSGLGLVNGKGVSVVLVNTSKGFELWKDVSDRCVSLERSVADAQRGNGQLMAPAPMHKNYHRFVELYPQKGLRKSLRIAFWRPYIRLIINDIKRNCGNT